jgi:obg-like ATPase 1
LQLLEKPECDREDWCKQQGAESALNKIITTGFRAIHLIYFFTAGADEVKCWQIRKATKAPQVCWLVGRPV